MDKIKIKCLHTTVLICTHILATDMMSCLAHQVQENIENNKTPIKIKHADEKGTVTGVSFSSPINRYALRFPHIPCIFLAIIFLIKNSTTATKYTHTYCVTCINVYIHTEMYKQRQDNCQ